MIAIIDYGMGNLRSVQKAFEFLGYEAEITDDPDRVRSAHKVVLPGVGAFADAMEALRGSGMIPVINETVDREKPFLGICLGMQLLFDTSEEGGEFEGLSVLPGRVRGLKDVRKIPHMGWNALSMKDAPLFEGLTGQPYVYFVHSYYADPADSRVVIATTRYGSDLCVAVRRGNVYATQFHPEKSGKVGLAMLKNFGEMT